MVPLAIDIETASPFNSPNNRGDFRNTDYFEFFAVARGYQSSTGDVIDRPSLSQSTGRYNKSASLDNFGS